MKRRVTEALLRAWPLPRPSVDGDKETRGRVLIVAGCREMPGAAVLAGMAALRVGAGKLAIATPDGAAAAVAAAMPEARVIALAETSSGAISARGARTAAALRDEFDAALIGPGLIETPALRTLVNALAGHAPQAVIVVDAGALTSLPRLRRDHAPAVAPRAWAPMVVTPHAGEMAALTGVGKETILADPVAAAREQARRRGVVVVLKGATTCIASPSDQQWIHDSESIGLATSGSGDVLAGAIAGMAARGAPPAQAAVWAVALHALAGQRLARRHGTLGLLARELPGELPALMHALSGGRRRS